MMPAITGWAALGQQLLGDDKAAHEAKGDLVVHRRREPRRPRQPLLLRRVRERFDARPQVLVLGAEAAIARRRHDELLQEEVLQAQRRGSRVRLSLIHI